jgi:hypothetical protein
MREKLGSFATLHAAQINTNRLMEKNLSLMKNAVSCLLTSCICLSCECVSLSHSVHPMCSVSYPLSHHVSHVTLVSEICLMLSLMLV